MAGVRLRKELVPADAPMNHGGESGTKGTFTREASRHGLGVQEFAAQVKAHPEDFSPEMRRKATFARNAASWHHA